MSKRWLALLLSIVILLGVLTSCSDPSQNADEPNTTDSIATPVVTDQPSTPSEDAPTGTNPTEEEILLADNELLLSQFRIIFSKNAKNSFYQSIISLSSSVQNNTGINLNPTMDSNLPEEAIAYEILIGNVDRSIVEPTKNELRSKDFLIRYDQESHRIIVLGGDDSATQQALHYFFSQWIDQERKTICLPQGNTYFHLARYPLLSVDIDGVSLKNYQVVVPAEADLLTYSAGLNIVDFFSAKMGITLPLVTDETNELPYEILVGKTNRSESNVACELHTDEYLLMQAESKLVLQGASYMVGSAFGARGPIVKTSTVGRNDPCPCGSGRKFKNCCGK